MNKHELISNFGSVKAVADLVGVTVKAVYKWPEDLPPRIADRIIGAAWRQNKTRNLPPVVVQ
jgi:hypothetical protein